VTAARLSNPTGRNTKACVVEIGPHSFFFSYETCIAYAGPLGAARIANVWGRTTGRHFRELGCGAFPTVEPDELGALIMRAIGGAAGEGRTAGRGARGTRAHHRNDDAAA
jgi:hypothetical protein